MMNRNRFKLSWFARVKDRAGNPDWNSLKQVIFKGTATVKKRQGEAEDLPVCVMGMTFLRYEGVIYSPVCVSLNKCGTPGRKEPQRP